MVFPGQLKERTFVALLHYPVLNRNKEIIASSITNLDIHDVARIVKTYALGGCFFVSPLERQRRLVERLTMHWRDGFGSTYNPDRSDALHTVGFCSSYDELLDEIEQRTNTKPEVIATSAKRQANVLTFDRFQEKVRTDSPERARILLFGTSFGIASSVLERVDHLLEPVQPDAEYNHLSVRSAVAIVVDRLFRSDRDYRSVIV